MKNIKNILLYTLSLSLIGIACDTEDDLIDDRKTDNPLPTDPGPLTGSRGSADFSNYVSLGNSLTAGFMDGALYTDGQSNSFPALLGAQLQIQGVGGGSFSQPDINAENGFNATFSNLSINPPLIMGRTELSLSLQAPVPTEGELPSPFTGDKSSLNNFGVPGIQLAQLLTPATGGPDNPMNPAYNALYARFATAPGTSTILGDALATNPTFFTLWIGSADVLGYALTGGDGSIPLTDPGSFQANYGTVLGQLAGSGAKGVAITIPPVVLIPFFRAVSYNPVPLDQASVDILNVGFAGFNTALDAIVANLGHSAEDAARRKVMYEVAEDNPLLIIDENLEDLSGKFDLLQGAGAITEQQRAALQPFVKARPAEPSDLVPLSTGAVIGQDLNPAAPGTALLGISVPMDDEYILTVEEQTEIITARATFNGIIEGLVEATNAGIGANNIVVYDTQPLFADLAGLTSELAVQLALSQAAQDTADGVLGIEVDGFNYTPDFSPNGLFSTDGIHPNPKGYSLVAKELIEVINAGFGADIPTIDLVPFRTIITAP